MCWSRLAKVQSKQDFQNFSEFRLSGLLVFGTQVDVGDGVKRLLQCHSSHSHSSGHFINKDKTNSGTKVLVCDQLFG